MDSNHNICYFSIESRKGGVGKTTVSLSLAQNLLARNYQVLYIDLDLIGTQLTGEFFKGKEKHLYEVQWKNRPANLVEIFKHTLVSGEKTPSFCKLEAAKGSGMLVAKEGVCNCLGSNIYIDSLGTGKPPTLLDDPRLLYDSLHAFWVLELVKSLAQSFAHCFLKEEVAVLLDHSPGYSSIESVFHDFLTDLGPKYGKFLYVSSIDAQDITACRQSMNNLHAIYKDKIAASNYYHSFFDKKIRAKKVSSDYFESVFSRLCVSAGTIPVYYSKKHMEETAFISILINKIPVNVYEKIIDKRKRTKIKSENILKKNEIPSPFLNHLQFFYNEWLFSDQKISIKSNNNRIRYKMSGNINNLKSDQSVYDDFKSYYKNKEKQIADFFRQEWSPMAPFEGLLKYLQSQECIEQNADISRLISTFTVTDEDIETAVEKFVLNSLNQKEPVEKKLNYVKTVTIKRIEEAKSGSKVSFHLDPIDFQELAGFEELLPRYGIAVYRMKEYERYCELISNLMGSFKRDSSIIYRLNQTDLSDKISKALEGQANQGENLHEEIKKIIAEQYNLSVLNNALDRVIKELNIR